MTDYQTWINGQPGESVSASDRALQYGDGLFETIRIRDYRPELPEAHLDRLVAGCNRLKFPSIDRTALRLELFEHASRHRHAVLKIIISRGCGGRGYRAVPGSDVSRIISVHPLTSPAGKPDVHGVQVRICDIRLAVQPALAGIKHLNRLEQVLARSEWDDACIAEGLMLDTSGQLIEATMSNVFLVCDNVLLTPELSNSGVAGVMRSAILDAAKQQTIDASIRSLTLEQVREAQELFVCNSLIGIWPVIRVIGCGDFSIGPVTRRLQAHLKEQLNTLNGNWYPS